MEEAQRVSCSKLSRFGRRHDIVGHCGNLGCPVFMGTQRFEWTQDCHRAGSPEEQALTENDLMKNAAVQITTGEGLEPGYNWDCFLASGCEIKAWREIPNGWY